MSQDSHPRKSVLREETWDQNHTVKIPPRARGTTAKFGKRRRSSARNYAKSAHLKNAIRALPDLRTGHKTKPCNKKDAPAE